MGHPITIMKAHYFFATLCRLKIWFLRPNPRMSITMHKCAQTCSIKIGIPFSKVVAFLYKWSNVFFLSSHIPKTNFPLSKERNFLFIYIISSSLYQLLKGLTQNKEGNEVKWGHTNFTMLNFQELGKVIRYVQYIYIFFFILY